MLPGHRDDEDVICLTQRTVNNSSPSMKSEHDVL
jgi:hypothetical protein